MIFRVVFLLFCCPALCPCRGETPSDDLLDEEPEIESYERDHWAYKPIVDHHPPKMENGSWGRTDIDRFILKKLSENNLQPFGDADRSTLIRRVSFDLTGLPPSADQVRTFLSDRRPGAYERLVDSFLASPEHGRRWAQFWLDLARFAETDGYEHDNLRANAWAYRDWVIDAINHDLPYDQFVRQQIAGDLLSSKEGNRAAAIATAFCMSGPDMPDINSQDERKHVLMNEITSTVGAVFLSLQVGCAQCHDHKYDAISQADFYRLRAFFDRSVALQKNKSVATLRPDADPKAISRLMVRGDWRSKGPKVSPAFPRILNPNASEVQETSPGDGRLELANWLTGSDHPITARAIVNRLWQYHFGRGLSLTPNDFGVMGESPTHPELLDYLATRLMRNGWSLKRLNREMVLSSTYRMRSVAPNPSGEVGEDEHHRWQASLAQDPENRWYGRFPRRRLDAEALRDAMFFVGETLNHRAGGPGVRPPLPPEMLHTLLKGQWRESENRADHFRRSIYIFARRNLRFPFFATFDRPSAQASCAVRTESTTAVQSLLLLNSELTMVAAEQLVSCVSSGSAGSEQSNYDELFLRLFSRFPSADERNECEAFLRTQTQLLEEGGHLDASHGAWDDLCRAMLNTSEFLYVD